MKPLWKRCTELRVPMTLLIPVARLPDLVPLLDSNPELTVVIDHMADSPLDHPKLLENLLVLQRYPKVFVKATHLWSLSRQVYPFRDAQEQVKRLYDRFGPDRLMAGTDWPIATDTSTYAQRVTLYREQFSFVSARDREAITCRTVQRVWDFGV